MSKRQAHPFWALLLSTTPADFEKIKEDLSTCLYNKRDGIVEI